MPRTSISFALSPEVAEQLPSDPAERERILELGLKEWRIRKALDAFARGEGSLAFAARQAGISLREMIPLAYAHGLEPRIAAEDLARDSLSIEQAADL